MDWRDQFRASWQRAQLRVGNLLIVGGAFNCSVVGGEFWFEECDQFDWFSSQQNHLQQDSNIGADPKVVPHQLWHEWEREFRHHYLNLLKVKNLIDIIWIDKPQPTRDYSIRTQSSEFAGEAWQQKVQKLRKHLRTFQCDSMVSVQAWNIRDWSSSRLPAGNYVAHRNRIFAQSAWRRFPVFASIYVLRDHQQRRNFALHKQIEDLNASWSTTEREYQRRSVLEAALRNVSIEGKILIKIFVWSHNFLASTASSTTTSFGAIWIFSRDNGNEFCCRAIATSRWERARRFGLLCRTKLFSITLHPL